MTTTMIISTIVEVIAVVLLVWGYCKEDKIIAFEDKCIEAIKHKIK